MLVTNRQQCRCMVVFHLSRLILILFFREVTCDLADGMTLHISVLCYALLSLPFISLSADF